MGFLPRLSCYTPRVGVHAAAAAAYIILLSLNSLPNKHLTKHAPVDDGPQCKLHSSPRRPLIIHSLPRLGSHRRAKTMERNPHSESKRTGSPFQKDKEPNGTAIVHEEVLQKTNYDIQKEKNNELLQKINKKTAEYQSSKPSSGVFTEVVTHGAFTSKKMEKEKASKVESVPTKYGNGSNSKSLLGYPSSANDLALDAKSDLESDPNISEEVKDKVIEKLFRLVSMVQHTYESKVRVMSDYEKFKDTHLKNEIRREKEHSEQLYKLNMSFQNEVIQAVQQLKSELDISRNISNNAEDSNVNNLEDSISFNTMNVGINDLDDVINNRTQQSERSVTKDDKSE